MNFFNKNTTFENIVFTEPKKGSDSKYFVALQSKPSDEKCDDILCQFGPLVNKDQLTDESTSLEVAYTDNKIKEFFSDCDDHILALCKDNKAEWFHSDDVSDSFLDNAILPSFKLNKKESKVVSKFRTSSSMLVFDNAKNEVEKASIKSGDKIYTIVQLAGIWFTKTRFGITWKLKQIKVHKEKSKTLGKYLFEDVEDGDDEMENVFPDE